MRIAIDFDGTLVDDDRPYDDVATPLRLKPGAVEALKQLKAAGHVILVHSTRSNRALWENWRLNPLWRDGLVRFDETIWEKNREINLARFNQMLDFLEKGLVGLVDSVHEGEKPICDLFIDDRAVAYGTGSKTLGWYAIAERWGDAPREADSAARETRPLRRPEVSPTDGMIEEELLDLQRIAAHAEKLRRDYYRAERYALSTPPGENVAIVMRWLIRAVDGEWVRDRVDVDFCEGGNGARYAYIPTNEVWLEQTLSAVDTAATAIHECVEAHLMQFLGMSYDDAHDLASYFEMKFRADPVAFDHVEFPDIVARAHALGVAYVDAKRTTPEIED